MTRVELLKKEFVGKIVRITGHGVDPPFVVQSVDILPNGFWQLCGETLTRGSFTGAHPISRMIGALSNFEFCGEIHDIT